MHDMLLEAKMAEKMTCPRCGGNLKIGEALKNTATYGMPDFAGQPDMTGQTFSYNGPAQLVDVDKREDCGYSRTR